MAKQVTLAARLDGAASPALVAELTTHKGEDIELDGSQVEMIGALCLEALLSIRHLWATEGYAVRFGTVSENLAENLGRFGLDETKFNNGDVA